MHARSAAIVSLLTATVMFITIYSVYSVVIINGIVLHTVGSCNVTEFLLSKGIPVNIDFGYGTPLHHASAARQDKAMKILLDHHANVCGPFLFLIF